MYSFPNLEPVCCSMSSSNCCFWPTYRLLRRQVRWSGIPISWIFHSLLWSTQLKALVQSMKQEVDVLLEFSCFFYDPTDVGNLISGSSAFSKFSLNIWKFLVCVWASFNFVLPIILGKFILSRDLSLGKFLWRSDLGLVSLAAWEQLKVPFTWVQKVESVKWLLAWEVLHLLISALSDPALLPAGGGKVPGCRGWDF